MFTVRQLARLAGVTPRTLHYYDQIGLLKPTRVGENGYRYYGDEAILRLQQIRLYRELDLPLEQIQRILAGPGFDVLGALESHRAELHRSIARLERLVGTVDHTIQYLRGEKAMSQKQMFDGFSEEQQAAYEKEAMQTYDPEVVKASNNRWKGYSAAEKERILAEGNAVYTGFLAAMPFGPTSPQAQACVTRWRKQIEYFWSPSDDQLLGMADLYNQDPRFKANYDRLDPGLAEFVREAVRFYVESRPK